MSLRVSLLTIFALLGCVCLARTVSAQPTQSSPFVRGNCNSDSKVNIADGVFLISHLFGDGPEGSCQDACDVNDDGQIDLGDAISIIAFRFLDGPAPATPFPNCGVDPSDDLLTCVESNGCDDTLIEWYVDPADPRLLFVERPDGVRVEYFGTRDASGMATSADFGVVTTPDGLSSTLAFDHQGQPRQITTPDGFAFRFNFTGPQAFVLTMITPLGEGQINLAVDLTQPIAMPAASTSLVTRSGSLQSWSEPIATSNPLQAVGAGTGAGAVSVNVTRCEQGVTDATVFVDLTGTNGSSNQFPAAHAGGGLYTTALPTENVDPSSFGAICQSIVGAIDFSCNYFDNSTAGQDTQICAAIASAFLATPIPGLDEAAVFLACEVALTAGRIYCATFGQSPGPGAPSVAQRMCDLISSAIDWALEPEIELQARALIVGEGIFESALLDAPAAGPFPPLSIDAGGEIEITSFTTAPVDPAPGQGYVATAEIACAPPNTLVQVSIVGTDGYTDSTSCTISGNEACTLSVPGAAEGVVDTVTVSVDGGPSSQVTLVF